jgi:hypothetical protein
MSDDAAKAAIKRRGRPRKTESAARMTAMFCLMMEPETKEWVLAHGGSELVRRLIAEEQGRLAEEDRKRREER